MVMDNKHPTGLKKKLKMSKHELRFKSRGSKKQGCLNAPLKSFTLRI